MNNAMKLCLAAVMIVMAAGPAYPQRKEILELNADVLNLRERVNQLQMTVDRDNAVLKGLMERTADAVNTISATVQKMTQAMDTVRTQNDTSGRELRTALTTLNGVVKELQSDVTSVRTQLTSMSGQITALKTTAEPLAGPDDLWRTAGVDYSVGNWDLAIGGLQEFLSKFPSDPRAADAQLKIGDALYAQKKYEAAVTQYDIVLQKYSESDTTKSALLKKGLAQAETDPPQAISTLSEVTKKFPGTSEAQTAQAKLKELQSRRPRTTPGR